MNKRLLIRNEFWFHIEIIESLIVKANEIIKIKIEDMDNLDIYLDVDVPLCYKKYISEKYPKIMFGRLNNYDYFIKGTVYDKDYEALDKNVNSTKKYIAHEITDRLKTNPNVFFLTPLSGKNYIYADVFPYSSCKNENIPIYIIQGNLNQNRRYLGLLKKILDQSYEHKFIIKLIGRGNLPNPLQKYKNKIVLRNNLNFIDFHKEFLDAYCILPLISKRTHPDYYTKKLTSTINYAKGYKLKCLIDKDLQEIYNLNDVEIYNDINDIQVSFKKTLDDFYKAKEEKKE